MADYFLAPAATLCSSGFVANLALIETLVDDFSHFVIDEGCHPSSHYALRWTGKPISSFTHNDIDALCQILDGLDGTRTLVICDSVGGMRGDLAPISELISITQRVGATLVIDDAHALGVLGRTGRGSAEAFQIDSDLIATDKVIRTGSLNKALSGHGGLVLGSCALRERVQAVSTFYTASPVPLAPIAVAQSATERLADGALCERLHMRGRKIKRVAKSLGWAVEEHDVPIISLHFQSNVRRSTAQQTLLNHGIYPSFVAYPGLPGRELLKLTITSAHTEDDIDSLLDVLPAL